MESRLVGELKVSMIGLGTMNFGSDWHGVGAIDDKTASSLLDLAIERGVTLIDTADIYGRGAAESMLGRLLGSRRKKLVLATKVLGEMREGDPSSGGLSPRHILEACEDSLRRLKTDWLDLYMPHHVDPGVPVEESLDAFDRLARAGKIRVLGVSNFNPEQLSQWLGLAAARGWAKPRFNQVQFSLAASFAARDVRPGVPLLAWSPLGGGLLSGKYAKGPRPDGRRRDPERAFPRLPEGRLGPLIELLGKVAQLERLTPAQAALGWVLARPFVASAVVGARDAGQLTETLAARPLGTKALALLDRAAALV